MPSEMDHQIEEFTAHLAVERNLSPRTIAAYRRDLRQFAVWLGEQSVDLASIERTTVRDYLGSRRDRGL